MYYPKTCCISKAAYDTSPATPSGYTPKTLVGNWFEERLEYQFQHHDKLSTYNADYKPKPSTKYSADLMWNALIRSQGGELVSKYSYYDFPNYFENFTSLYDLSYNHYPKWKRDTEDLIITRVHRFRLDRNDPVEDYIDPFHNLTKYGLVDSKRVLWDSQKIDPRHTVTSNYKDEYQPPKLEDMEKCRRAVPRSNSSKLVEINEYAAKLPFRGVPINVVPPSQNIVTVPRKSRCDPITWDCPDKWRNVPDKCAEALIPPRPQPVTLLKCIQDFGKNQGDVAATE